MYKRLVDAVRKLLGKSTSNKTPSMSSQGWNPSNLGSNPADHGKNPPGGPQP